jgi:hypothetical protein
VGAHAGDHVLRDRHGERIRALEQHPDPAAQVHQIAALPVDAFAVEQHLPLAAEARDLVVHPVQRPQEGALARPGGPEQREDPAALDLKAHRPQHRHRAEPERELERLECRSCAARGGPGHRALTGKTPRSILVQSFREPNVSSAQ